MRHTPASAGSKSAKTHNNVENILANISWLKKIKSNDSANIEDFELPPVIFVHALSFVSSMYIKDLSYSIYVHDVLGFAGAGTRS